MAKVSKVQEISPERELTSPGELDDELTPEETLAKQRMESGEEPFPEGDQPDDTAPEGEPEIKADSEIEAEAQEASDERESPRIPLAELQKERTRRQEIEKQHKELEERYNRADERLRTLNELIAARQAQENQQHPERDVEPDREEDPFAWYEWKIRQSDRALESMQQQVQGYGMVTQQTQFANQLQYMENQYASQNPDYAPTLNKLAAHVDNMFKPAYPDPNVRTQAVQAWTRQVVAAALQRGQNPSEVIYQMAKEAGLTSSEAKEVVQEVAAQAPSQIAQLRKAATAQRSLSSVAGNAPARKYTIEDLANMPDDEYERFKESLGENDDVMRRFTH